MAKKSTKKEPAVMSIGGVPTAAGLATRGRDLASMQPDGRYHITPTGHAELGSALKANAQERILRGEDIWVRPPSSGKRRDHHD